MKVFIYKLFVFLAIFSIIVVGISRFDNTGRCHIKNDNVKKLACMSSFDSLDILFLGNSYCYSGINPLYFDSAGFKTFNLGVASAGMNYYTLLVNDYLTSVQKKPKSVFILVSPMALSDKADDAMNNPIYRYLNTPVSVEKYMLLYDHSLLKSYPKIIARSFVKAFTNLYSSVTAKQNFCNATENEMFATKGFIASTNKTSLKEEFKTNHFFTQLSKNKFDTTRANKLLNLAKSLESKNIKVVFFELPSNRLYSFFKADYLTDYNSLISTIKQQYNFINIDTTLNDTFYRDQDHLNTYGATIVSKEMIKQIKAHKEVSALLNTH